MIYLEEEIATHRKFVIAGAMNAHGGLYAVLGLYVAGLGWSRRHATNGHVDDEYLQGPVTQKNHKTDAKKIAEILAHPKVRLWHRVRGGYRIHDYLDHNESAAQLKQRRKLERLRKRRERERKRTQAVPATHPTVTHSVRPDKVVTSMRTPRARGTTPTPTPTVRTYEEPAHGADGSLLRWRHTRSRGTDGVGHPKVAVLAALARHVIAQHPDELDDGELEELIKCAAARANLKYDTRTVGVALVNARKVGAHIDRRRARQRSA